MTRPRQLTALTLAVVAAGALSGLAALPDTAEPLGPLVVDTAPPVPPAPVTGHGTGASLPDPTPTPRAATRHRAPAGRGLPAWSPLVGCRHVPAGALCSTAYCDPGIMADGTRVDAHPFGTIAAGNRWPLGTRLTIVETGRTLTVRDHIGHGSDLDLALPGACPAARRYGRRVVHVIIAT